ncbi:hypothetical protein ACK32U_01905 [Aeromonas dhakensis]|uniref:hypothetical protein n=1 Tax=Aeromonas dhakensis TaxID=196024 RepID=UPI0039894552
MTVLVQIDNNRGCCSVVYETTISDYLRLVEHAYANKGGLKQQRPPLKTATAKDIRHRMVDDICNGAILPPVVIGVISEKDIASLINAFPDRMHVTDFIAKIQIDNITIIDGMQRTTAILDAFKKKPEIENNIVRVELWIAKSVSPLIYRMLILNTGQIPWDITRQLDTVYASLLSEVGKSLPEISVLTKDLNMRRSGAGQYQSSHIIELYMIFSSREVDVDIKQHLQSEFSRLNIIESSSHNEFLSYFTSALNIMVRFDVAWSKATSNDVREYIQDEGQSIANWKITSGQDIFKSSPARAGFIAAIATSILDISGFDVPWDEVPERLQKVNTDMDKFLKKINGFSTDELISFLCLDILNERLDKKSGKVGEYERGLYFRAFTQLLEHSHRLSNMKPCWVK